MPFYTYKCVEHGLYDLLQGMDEEHIGVCSKCKRVFYPIKALGDLPTTKTKIAYNRQELWKNLESEGLMDKGTLEADNKHIEEQKKILMDGK